MGHVPGALSCYIWARTKFRRAAVLTVPATELVAVGAYRRGRDRQIPEVPGECLRSGIGEGAARHVAGSCAVDRACPPGRQHHVLRRPLLDAGLSAQPRCMCQSGPGLAVLQPAENAVPRTLRRRCKPSGTTAHGKPRDSARAKERLVQLGAACNALHCHEIPGCGPRTGPAWQSVHKSCAPHSGRDTLRVAA